VDDLGISLIALNNYIWTTYVRVTTTCRDATTIWSPEQAVPRIPYRLGVSGLPDRAAGVAGRPGLSCGQDARTFQNGHNASVKKTSAALVAVPLVASMLLAACGGDAKPGASSSSTSTSSPTATAPPTTASSTTSDPNIPVAARAHTPAGAEAFVRYFFAQVNLAWSTPNPAALDGLYTPTCTTCTAIRGSAADYKAKGLRYRDTPLTRISPSSVTAATGATARVNATAMQEASAVVDRDGKVVEAVPRTPSTFDLTLTWVRGGWQVSLMQVQA
jgi:hypothetical protein